jgi:hypothetical protein
MTKYNSPNICRWVAAAAFPAVTFLSGTIAWSASSHQRQLEIFGCWSRDGPELSEDQVAHHMCRSNLTMCLKDNGKWDGWLLESVCIGSDGAGGAWRRLSASTLLINGLKCKLDYAKHGSSFVLSDCDYGRCLACRPVNDRGGPKARAGVPPARQIKTEPRFRGSAKASTALAELSLTSPAS